MAIAVREHGGSGPAVVVLHGGPGAPGSARSLARALADRFRVLEPLQRGSGETPLTVARHVDDLHEVIGARGSVRRPALVGHSWGAMLALAYAAAHPDRVAALALVGCGTFDPASRARLRAVREGRMDDAFRARRAGLEARFADPDARLAALGTLLEPLDSFDAIPEEAAHARFDARAHDETWGDMLRLQEEGVYPAAFAAIAAPVLMLHGAADPHPGRMIYESLARHLSQLAYREWARCGHYPWRERAVGAEFLAVLGAWLAERLRGEREG